MVQPLAGTDVATESGPGIEVRITTNFSGTIAPDGSFNGLGTYTRIINDAIDASGTITFSGKGSENDLMVRKHRGRTQKGIPV